MGWRWRRSVHVSIGVPGGQRLQVLLELEIQAVSKPPNMGAGILCKRV